MSTDNKAITILLLCISCCTETTRFIICEDLAITLLKDEGSVCAVVRNFTKCFLKETRLYTHSSGDDDIRELESHMLAELAKMEIICEIDAAALVEELLEEDKQGVERISSPPKGYEKATSLRDCIDSLEAEATEGVQCSLLPPFIKCNIRVLNVDKLTINDTADHTALAPSIKEGLDKIGLGCDIDLPALIEEVRRERTQENRSGFSALTFHPVILSVCIFTTLYVFH